MKACVGLLLTLAPAALDNVGKSLKIDVARSVFEKIMTDRNPRP